MQVLEGLSNDLCMEVMSAAQGPLHRLLPLLPDGYHALAMQARHPSIFSRHTLTFTCASAPMLTVVAPLLGASFPHLTSISFREQPLPNIGSDSLFRGLGDLPRLALLDLSKTVWSSAAAAAAAMHLPAAAALETLILSGSRITSSALASIVFALRTLQMLRVLALGSTDPSGSYATAVWLARDQLALESLSLDLPNGVPALFAQGLCRPPRPPGSRARVPGGRGDRGLQWLRRLHIRSGRPLSTLQLCGVSALMHLEDLRVAFWDPSGHDSPQALRSDALMDALAELPTLAALDLSMHVLTPGSENAFLESTAVSCLTALQRLRISAPGAVISGAFLAGLGKGLRELSLRCATVASASGLARVLRTAAPQLEDLQVDAWPVGDAVPHAAGLGSLAALTALTALRLGRCRFDDDAAAVVAACMEHMHALQEVALGCTLMSMEGCARLGGALSASPAQIRSLNIVGNGGGPGRELAALSRAFPRLHALQDLSLAYLSLKSAAAVGEVADCLAAATRLTRLRLDGVAAAPEACDRISAGLVGLASLQRLELEEHYCGGASACGHSAADTPFTRALTALTALTALCCGSCTGMARDSAIAAGIMHAAAASSAHRLRELRLTNCAIAAATHPLPRNRRRGIRFGQPTQHAQHAQQGGSSGPRAQAATLLCSALARLEGLEVLDLSGNGALGDDFAEQLGEAAPRLPELRQVLLDRCGVGAPGLRRLLRWLPAAPRAQRLQVNEYAVAAAELEAPVQRAVACCHVG